MNVLSHNTITICLKRLALICVSVLALSAGVLHAEPYFVHKNGMMVLDKATGLVWMRCSNLQIWNGYSCSGASNEMTFDTALGAAMQHNMIKKLMVDGVTDWKVPTVRELASLIYCSSGEFKKTIDLKTDGAHIPNECGGTFARPTINQNAFPNTISGGYWTSVLTDAEKKTAYGYGFGNGSFWYDVRDKKYFVRYVRAKRLIGDEATADFMPLDKKLAQEQPLQEEERQRKTIEDQKNIDRYKAEQARKSAEWDGLLASGPQNMYLQAGRKQRDGDRYSASRIYNAIIDTYPESPFAVKASDELSRLQREGR
jgi:Protein of unknown function (DUF1566)